MYLYALAFLNESLDPFQPVLEVFHILLVKIVVDIFAIIINDLVLEFNDGQFD